jgi:S1-C subfamily serine protease
MDLSATLRPAAARAAAAIALAALAACSPTHRQAAAPARPASAPASGSAYASPFASAPTVTLPDFASLTAAAGPAVVNVRVEGVRKLGGSDGKTERDDDC